MAKRNKNIWILLVFLLAGLVVGGLLGRLAAEVPSLWWLGYNQSFGLSNPFTIDLGIMQLTFGLMIDINVASILGMLIAVLIYEKV